MGVRTEGVTRVHESDGLNPVPWDYHENSSSALTGATVQAAPGAGFQIIITEILVSHGAAVAMNVLLSAGGSTIWGPHYLEDIAGRGLFWKGRKPVSENTALTITTSAAIAHGIDIQGHILRT